MAKKDQKLTLSDLTRGLQQGKLAMNPAIQAQIDAAMAAPEVKTDSLNTNIARLAKTIELNTKVLDANSKITQGKGPPGPSDLSEADIENQKIVDHQTELLEKIEENTRYVKTKAKEEEKKTDKKPFTIGGWLTSIAVALGIAAGVFLGKLRAFMLVAKSIGKGIANLAKFAKDIIPYEAKYLKIAFRDMVTKMGINLEYGSNIVKDFFKNRFGKFFAKIESGFSAFSEFFSKSFAKVSSGASKIGGVFKSIGAAITKFFAPIAEAWTTIKTYSSSVQKIVGGISNTIGKIFGFFGKIGEFFTTVAGKAVSFTKVFSAVAKIVGKIAYPITIIMGLYDAILGSIEGFKKGGWVGGIKGFVKGAWDSIVSSFLDLLKDMISWVLGAVGFKDAEKWLDSWSFKDLFGKFWDMVFKPFEMIQDFFMKLEIPKFSVPLLGEFGPYKLADLTGGEAKAKPADKKVKAVSAPAEANKVYAQSAENKEADKKVVQPKSSTVITAPTQVNNQTQNAFVKTPIRNNDSTINRYLSLNF